MNIKDEIVKFTNDINKEFETHFCDIYSVWASKERLLTIVVDYPLCREVKFFIYKVPLLRDENYFKDIFEFVTKEINIFINEVSEQYGYKHKKSK